MTFIRFFIATLLLASCTTKSEDTSSATRQEEDNHTKEVTDLVIAPIETEGDRFLLVELFTSESCYDCPPSEEALNDLIKSLEGTGMNILPIAVHVDYWNDLIDGEDDCRGNWIDPYSKGIYTERQFTLASMADTRPATPQVYVNGQHPMNDPNLDSLKILAAQYETEQSLFELDLEFGGIEGDVLYVDYDMSPATDTLKFRENMASQLVVMLLEDDVESYPDKGENCGEHLHHLNLLRAKSAVTLRGEGSGRIALEIPNDLNIIKAHVGAFIQNLMTHEIVGGNHGFRFH